MKQAASIDDLKLPMLLPGITISTSATDFAPIKQMQLSKFDGKTFELFGDVISRLAIDEAIVREDRQSLEVAVGAQALLVTFTRAHRAAPWSPADRACQSPR